jgi:hypothetical protein
MIDTLKALLDLGKTLLGVKADLAKAGLEQRERSAVYLDKVSEALSQIVDTFRAGNGIPHEACGSLSGYVRLLLDAMTPSLDAEKLSYYSELLSGAALTRQLLAEISQAGIESSSDKEEALADLQTACGEFKALASFLRS